MGPRRTILVVDDDQDGAVSLALLLEIDGHRVTVRYDGTSALEHLAAEQADIAFIDLTMPDMSGYELCRRIRASNRGRDMFLFALTGWTHAEPDALAAGFDGVLVKPCTREQLRSVVSDPAAESRGARVERRGPLAVAPSSRDDVEEA